MLVSGSVIAYEKIHNFPASEASLIPMVVIGDILQEAKTNTAGGLPANIHRFVAAQAENDDTVRPDPLKGGTMMRCGPPPRIPVANEGL